MHVTRRPDLYGVAQMEKDRSTYPRKIEEGSYRGYDASLNALKKRKLVGGGMGRRPMSLGSARGHTSRSAITSSSPPYLSRYLLVG